MLGLLTLQNHRCKNQPLHFARLCKIKIKFFSNFWRINFFNVLADCCYIIIAAVSDPSRRSNFRPGQTSKSRFAPSRAVNTSLLQCPCWRPTIYYRFAELGNIIKLYDMLGWPATQILVFCLTRACWAAFLPDDCNMDGFLSGGHVTATDSLD